MAYAKYSAKADGVGLENKGALCDFIADTEADLASIPVGGAGLDGVRAGSTAIVMSDSGGEKSVWILTAGLQWEKLCAIGGAADE